MRSKPLGERGVDVNERTETPLIDFVRAGSGWHTHMLSRVAITADRSPLERGRLDDVFRRRRIRTFATSMAPGGEPGSRRHLLTWPTRKPEPGSAIAQLEQIRAELLTLDEDALDFYVSLVDVHEDELAWQCLVFAARDSGAPTSVWNHLDAVALSMGIQDDDDLFDTTVALVRQHVPST